jgi:transposase
MKRVEGLSAREIGRRTGLARDTVSRLLAAEEPPRYSRAPAASILDPFKDWICEQLQADPKVPSQRLRELAAEIGYAGGKTIFDAYVREVRPRFLVKRTFQRTIYRPAELIQCDLWEPSAHVPVGYGQTRRGWVVTTQSCWSRAFAGTLVFSKEAPDILAGLARSISRLGVRPEKLVWDRESAIAGRGKPSEAFLSFCGQLQAGWIILDAGDAQAKGQLERQHQFLRSNFEPRRFFANHLDFQDQLDRWAEKVNARAHRTIRGIPAERLAKERQQRPLGAVTAQTDRRWVARVAPAAATRCSPAGVSRSVSPSARSPRWSWIPASSLLSTPGSSRVSRRSSTPRIRASSSISVSVAGNDTRSMSSSVPCPSMTR